VVWPVGVGLRWVRQTMGVAHMVVQGHPSELCLQVKTHGAESLPSFYDRQHELQMLNTLLKGVPTEITLVSAAHV
jgi:hypothetical protein